MLARGNIVAENGRTLIDPILLEWPNEVKNTVNLKNKLNHKDFLIPANNNYT